jgi:tRNA (guanine26-N2/guanine27-N2)-dimethyltransferase
MFRYPVQEVVEGSARIIVPKFSEPKAKKYYTALPVFFNPVMKLNRDITIYIYKRYHHLRDKFLKYCDALSGTGIRGIRIAKEIPYEKEVYFNDISNDAYELITYNAKKELKNVNYFINNIDARELFIKHKFDVIDIDPFGSPIKFIESALFSLGRKGLLGITATDVPVLYGKYPKTCLRRYYSNSLQVDCSHEVGLRILIGAIARKAAESDKAINVLFSFYTKHYYRLFIEIEQNVKAADLCLSKLGFLFYCPSCFERKINKNFSDLKLICDVCNSRAKYAGPLWLGSLIDRRFIKPILGGIKDYSIKRFFNKLLNELDVPFYYDLHFLCDRLNIPVPSFASLENYFKKNDLLWSRTHFSVYGFKTTGKIEGVYKFLKKI